jgi:hypothetical protein
VVKIGEDGVATIRGRKIVMPEGIKPGDTFDLPGKLSTKYPEGVKFKEGGWGRLFSLPRCGSRHWRRNYHENQDDR